MTRTRLLFALGLSALLLAAPARAQTTLTVSAWVPPGHPMVKDTLVPWAAEVEQQTQGRVKFNFLPKAVVGPAQTFDAVRDGVADLSFIVDGYTPNRFVLSKLVELPFIASSSEAGSVAYWRVYESQLAKVNEHRGVTVLSVCVHGPGSLFMAKKPVRTVADLNGLKLRVGGGLINDIIKTTGAVPLLKPAPETFELVNGGVADGSASPAEMMASMRVAPAIKYGLRVPGGLYNTAFTVIMNTARLRALSPQDQATIQRLSGEAMARRAGRAWDEADLRGLEALKANQAVVETASAEFVEQIRQRTAGLEQAWVAEAKTKGVDGAAALAQLRREIKTAQ